MAVNLAVHKMDDYLRSELEKRPVSVTADPFTAIENHVGN